MQARNLSGNFGDVLRHSNEGLQSLLEDDNVEAVEVFKATDAEIKKHNKYSIGKRFQKAPKIK